MNGLLMQTVHTAARCCAPAAAFGKIAFANFASARNSFERSADAGRSNRSTVLRTGCRIRQKNREEYHESDNTIFIE